MKLRGKIYYYQGRVPVDLQELLGFRWINHSTKMQKPADAERVIVRLTNRLMDLYTELRRDPHSPDDAREKLQAVLLGKPRPQSLPPSLTSPNFPEGIPKPDKRKKHTLAELCERYQQEKAIAWSYRTKKELPGQLDKLSAHFGNIDITNINRKDVQAYVEHLQEQEKSTTTIRKYVHLLASVFEYADALGWATHNPAAKFTLPKDKRPKHTLKDPFTTEETLTLFRDLQARKENLYADGHHERYWVPLLLAYTGARVNEICQLQTHDIQEEDGLPYISIQVGEQPEGDIEAYRLKNISSNRWVPIHKDLLALGFLVYVNRMRSLNQQQLFPALKLGPNGYSHYFVRKWTSKYTKNWPGWYRVALGDTPKSNHNWRHTFIDMLKQRQTINGLNKKHTDISIEELAGHASQGESLSRYGKRLYLEILQKALHDYVDYSFLPSIKDRKLVIYDDSDVELFPSLGFDDDVRIVTCGSVERIVNYGNTTEEINAVSQFWRPDIHGYSDFHSAIDDFFPEPSASQFQIASYKKPTRKTLKSKR